MAICAKKRMFAAIALSLSLTCSLVPAAALAEGLDSAPQGLEDSPEELDDSSEGSDSAPEEEELAAQDADLAAQDAWVRWGRLGGPTALDTMASITAEWQDADVVVLATIEGYWDTLVGAGVAGLAGAPVLMTSPSGLSAQTAKELSRLSPSTVVVLGGVLALPDAVVRQAAEAAGGAKVVRLAGQDAAATSVEALRGGLAASGVPGAAWSKTAIVATNEGYWDALAASPISWAKHMPIVLTSGVHMIRADAVSAMRASGIEQAVVVGGELAVGPEVVQSLKAAGIAVRRIGGATAVDTAELIADWAIDELGMSADGMCVATTDGYWDALSGSALCGRRGSCLLLTNRSKCASTGAYVRRRCAGISRCDILGGELAVPRDVAVSLEYAVNGTSLYDAYLPILEDAEAQRGLFHSGGATSYGVLDSDGDGVPELYIQLVVKGGVWSWAFVAQGSSVSCMTRNMNLHEPYRSAMSGRFCVDGQGQLYQVSSGEVPGDVCRLVKQGDALIKGEAVLRAPDVPSQTLWSNLNYYWQQRDEEMSRRGMRYFAEESSVRDRSLLRSATLS